MTQVFLMMSVLFISMFNFGSEMIQNLFSLYNNSTIFKSNVYFVLATFIVSFTMFFQIKFYERYYNILINENTDELDLSEELHENK